MKLAKRSSVSQEKESVVPQPDRGSALLLVDLQNDFFPGGAVPVAEADSLLSIINAYIKRFSTQGLAIFATRDWHPPDHSSFKEQSGTWPTHCVQGSHGAQFHSKLVMPPGTMVISKGTNQKNDAYSGFDGSLSDRLEDGNIKTLFVLGLATDYCVKETVLDACKLGYKVVILEDAIRGVNLNPDDSANALQAMLAAGAVKSNSQELGLGTDQP